MAALSSRLALVSGLRRVPCTASLSSSGSASSLRVRVGCEEEMERIGAAFGVHASPGSTICLSGDLLGRCFRAWRDCAQQHGAFKLLQGRGELLTISRPPPGEVQVGLDAKRSPSPNVASEARDNSSRPSSTPHTRFAA